MVADLGLKVHRTATCKHRKWQAVEANMPTRRSQDWMRKMSKIISLWIHKKSRLRSWTMQRRVF